MERNSLYEEILGYVKEIINNNKENNIKSTRKNIKNDLVKRNLKNRRIKLNENEVNEYINAFIRNNEIDEIEDDNRRAQFINELQKFEEITQIDKIKQEEQPKKKTSGFHIKFR